MNVPTFCRVFTGLSLLAVPTLAAGPAANAPGPNDPIVPATQAILENGRLSFRFQLPLHEQAVPYRGKLRVYKAYQVRWGRPGMEEVQSGPWGPRAKSTAVKWTIPETPRPGVTYTFKVQFGISRGGQFGPDYSWSNWFVVRYTVPRR